MTIEQVKENILNIGEVNQDDFNNSIVAAFEDYSFDSADYVIITTGESGKYEYPNKYLAYVDHEDAPQIVIEVEYTEYGVAIDEVRIIY